MLMPARIALFISIVAVATPAAAQQNVAHLIELVQQHGRQGMKYDPSICKVLGIQQDNSQCDGFTRLTVSQGPDVHAIDIFRVKGSSAIDMLLTYHNDQEEHVFLAASNGTLLKAFYGSVGKGLNSVPIAQVSKDFANELRTTEDLIAQALKGGAKGAQ